MAAPKSVSRKPRTSSKASTPPRIAFFFGAGAELAYGLPTGGRFALEVIRRAKDPAEAFKMDRARVAASCTAEYRDWLPADFATRTVSRLGKAEHGRIFEDSLRAGYLRVVNVLDEYDARAIAFLAQHGLDDRAVSTRFTDLSGGTSFGATPYAAVSVSDSLTHEPTRLFRSRYFSAILALAKDGVNSDEMTRLARATIQFYLGAYGQGAMDSMAAEPLKNVPTDNPAFAELGRLFDVNAVDAGAAAFDEVMNYHSTGAVDASPAGLFRALAIGVLESAVETFLDYRTMLDELLPALYQPKHAWAKFTKVNLFLRATRDYVLEQQVAAHGKTEGYYHELAAAIDAGLLSAERIATSNYTDLCSRALHRMHAEPVVALNGSLDRFLDPYKNAIVRAVDAPTIPRFLVPFLFTQSGMKPLTSVHVSRDYVTFFDAMCSSQAVVAAGFGFNADDGHINTLFREAVDEAHRRLIVLDFTPGGAYDSAFRRRTIAANLRIDNEDRIVVLPIDGHRRVHGRPWPQEVVAAAR